MKRSYRKFLLSGAVVLALSACNGQKAPTQNPTQPAGNNTLDSAALSTAVSSTLSALPPTQPASGLPTRTPLPTLTPSVAAAGNTTNNTAVAVQPTQVPAGNTGAATAALTNTQPSNTQPTTAAAQPAGPTSTSALLAVTLPPSATVIPAAGLSIGPAPSLDLKLPDGWKGEYYLLPVREPLAQVSINLARYYGPVKSNGRGTILVLWNFPSIGAPPTVPPVSNLPTATYAPNVTPLSYQQQLLWSDGLRMLSGTVVEITCNTATYDQRYFQFGTATGIGAYFNVSQCPTEPDTVGWFAGVNQFGVNYLFYVYIEPIQAYNDSRAYMQQILDTITFKAPPTPVGTSNATSSPPLTNTPG